MTRFRLHRGWLPSLPEILFGLVTAAAIGYLQTGTCPATAGGTAGTASLLQRAKAARVIEPGQRSGMWAD